MRIKDAVLFSTGSDILTEQAGPLLDLVNELANEFPQELTIEGHTDDRPITTPRFPSNWELSTARATSCLRDLV